MSYYEYEGSPMNPFAPLLGRVVNAVHIETNHQGAMRFDCGWQGADRIYVSTEGDCCSETWFADVIGLNTLIGCEVRGIEVLELPTPEDERTRQESDEAYGIRLMTRKGHCDIVYRNSSNGYYGGSANCMRREDGDKEEWTQITDDWQA